LYKIFYTLKEKYFSCPLIHVFPADVLVNTTSTEQKRIQTHIPPLHLSLHPSLTDFNVARRDIAYKKIKENRKIRRAEMIFEGFKIHKNCDTRLRRANVR